MDQLHLLYRYISRYVILFYVNKKVQKNVIENVSLIIGSRSGSDQGIQIPSVSKICASGTVALWQRVLWILNRLCSNPDPASHVRSDPDPAPEPNRIQLF